MKNKPLIISALVSTTMLLAWCGSKTTAIPTEQPKEVSVVAQTWMVQTGTMQTWTTQPSSKPTNLKLFANEAKSTTITRESIMNDIKDFNNSITNPADRIDISKITSSQLPDYIAKFPFSLANGVTENIYVSVKSLEGIDAVALIKIKQELQNTSTDAEYIMRNIFPDRGYPQKWWWYGHYDQTYDMPQITIPGARQSRVFAYFGWQAFPLTPAIRILFIKNNHLVGITYAYTDYLSEAFMNGYYAYYDWLLVKGNNNPDFTTYIIKNKAEFEKWVQTLVQKIQTVVGIQ